MKRASPTPRRTVSAATSRRLLQAVQPTIAAATLNPSQLLALQAFDVAFRAGSFKASAQFLNLSPSAASHLTAIRTTPVAAPSLARRLDLRKPSDLRRAALIHVTAFPAAWPLWLEHAGVAKLKPARTISVDTFVAAMQAAEQGAGIALG